MRRIAIGDIHGCQKQLEELLEHEVKMTKEDEIYLLGDIISKGDYSSGTLDYILEKRTEGFNIQAIIGNHEYKFLTLFHHDFPMLEEYAESYKCWDLLTENTEEYLAFLSALPFYYDLGDWLLLHSEIMFDQPPGNRDLRSMFGGNALTDLLNIPDIGNRRQAHGHLARALSDIEADAERKVDSIGIDGGCVYGDFGYLVGLNLDDWTLYTVDRFP